MDAGGIDIVERPNCTRQFTFKGANEIYVLNEVCCAKRFAAVKNLVTHRPAGRQALLGDLDADAFNIVCWDEKLAAVPADFVGGVGLLELCDDRARVGDFEITIEQSHLRRGDAAAQEYEKPDHYCANQAHHYEPGCT